VRLALEQCSLYFVLCPPGQNNPRWTMESEVWHEERGEKCVSSNVVSFLPGCPEICMLHDGRECLVTTEVDLGACRITSVQTPLDSSLPATRIERTFSEEGMLVRMNCEEVEATSEFIRCIDDI